MDSELFYNTLIICNKFENSDCYPTFFPTLYFCYCMDFLGYVALAGLRFLSKSKKYFVARDQLTSTPFVLIFLFVD